MMWELKKVRTKKSYDAYYWLVFTILYFVLVIVFSISIMRDTLRNHNGFLFFFVMEALFILSCCFFVKTAAKLLREYQFVPSGIIEYSAFRRKRNIAWSDFPYAYIVWMRPLFRLPHSSEQFFLFSKSPLPARITKWIYKEQGYYKYSKKYIIFGYSEELEQGIRDIHPEITFVKRNLQ